MDNIRYRRVHKHGNPELESELGATGGSHLKLCFKYAEVQQEVKVSTVLTITSIKRVWMLYMAKRKERPYCCLRGGRWRQHSRHCPGYSDLYTEHGHKSCITRSYIRCKYSSPDAIHSGRPETSHSGRGLLIFSSISSSSFTFVTAVRSKVGGLFSAPVRRNVPPRSVSPIFHCTTPGF